MESKRELNSSLHQKGNFRKEDVKRDQKLNWKSIDLEMVMILNISRGVMSHARRKHCLKNCVPTADTCFQLLFFMSTDCLIFYKQVLHLKNMISFIDNFSCFDLNQHFSYYFHKGYVILFTILLLVV